MRVLLGLSCVGSTREPAAGFYPKMGFFQNAENPTVVTYPAAAFSWSYSTFEIHSDLLPPSVIDSRDLAFPTVPLQPTPHSMYPPPNEL